MAKEKRITEFEFSLGLYKNNVRHIIVSRFFNSNNSVIHLGELDVYGIEKIIREELKSQNIKHIQVRQAKNPKSQFVETETVLSLNVRRRIDENIYTMLLDTDLHVGFLCDQIRFNLNLKPVLASIINILRNGYEYE